LRNKKTNEPLYIFSRLFIYSFIENEINIRAIWRVVVVRPIYYCVLFGGVFFRMFFVTGSDGVPCSAQKGFFLGDYFYSRDFSPNFTITKLIW